MNKAQWKSFYDKLTVLEEQKSQIKGMQNKLIADNKSGNNFSNMDFFKALFFKVKLNPNKMQRIFDTKEQSALDLSQMQESKRNEGMNIKE